MGLDPGLLQGLEGAAGMEASLPFSQPGWESELCSRAAVGAGSESLWQERVSHCCDKRTKSCSCV